MSARLLSPAETRIWAACFVFVAILLVLTRFTSADPDSALHAALSARLAEGPVSGWIAPEWWGEWNSTGLYREHPVGVFLLPVALGSLGVPAVQAAYVVGVGAGLVSLLLIGHLVMRLTSREDARAVLFLLLIMPVAFVFRIRANHEYPMLVCLLAVIVGIDGVRRAWAWSALVVAGLVAALLIKGAFVVLVLAGAALWIALNPTRSGGSAARPIAAVAMGVAAMVLAAVAYDAVYLRVTGETFWAGYWGRQLGPLTLATPLDGATTLASHVLFYVSRLIWHPAPWSVVLLVAAARRGGALGEWWRHTPESARRGLLFGLGFAALSLVVLSPSSRFAERYAFSASFAVGTVGAVVAYRSWSRVKAGVAWLDRTVPAAPALAWLALVLLRLALGPWLPRV